MAIRDVILEGDPVLRRMAREVGTVDARICSLLDDLVDTMRAQNGAGIAAPQVGISRRVCVVEEGDTLYELVDPVIIEQEGEIEELEGCLSCPGKAGYVIRPVHVRVEATNRAGERVTHEGEGHLARAFCHEIDHLNGILYLDKVTRMADPDEFNEIDEFDEEEE